MKNTLSVNWAEARREKGLTLHQAAEASGYGPATINGLEKRGEGSERLKQSLASIYGVKYTPPGGYSSGLIPIKEHLEIEEGLKEEPATYGIDWKTRAIDAEAKLAEIKRVLSN